MLNLEILEQDGGTAKKGNYLWSVENEGKVVAQGVAKGHQRAKGWKKLLKKVTNAAMKVPEQEPEQPDLFSKKVHVPYPDFTPEHAT